ncbi:MAG: hypothetical protein OEV40_25240 [Acidimicrobiia bacterium]|nr:hypothetical protein [Acidimicrobiia bacterium]
MGPGGAVNLDTPAFIAMVLLASVAGAPLGVKFVMGAKGNVTTGRSSR